MSDHWATFFVTNSLMQDQPDQPTPNSKRE
jgi:hypothetical protein